MRYRFLIAALVVIATGMAGYFAFTPTVNVPVRAAVIGYSDEAKLLERLKIAKGYKLSVFATGLGRARVIKQIPGGSFIVTAARDGKVLLVRADTNNDGRSDGVHELLSGLNRPHGLMIEGDTVFVAEQHQISAFALAGEDDPATARLTRLRTVLDGMPDDGGHVTRTITRGPDGRIYVSVGSSCNVCIETHPWRAAIIRFVEGQKPEVFAAGLRNSVGMDWHPRTGALYAVNAGRDILGDDFPREELNLVEKGKHYGWPYFNENNVPDPDLGAEKPADLIETTVPVHMFTAHSTPLSIRFLRHNKAAKPGTVALVARHGSWNRSTKSGYDIVLLRFHAGGQVTEEPFITGFEENEEVVGRPVDVYETPDGAIWITDDFAGTVYKVIRQAG
jgi:glucose/arabinose dehydrogenase